MTDRNDELDQFRQAVTGLGASASAAALRHVSHLAEHDGGQTALDHIASLSALSQRAMSCMTVADQAEAEGDMDLAELGWLKTLSLMNHLAEDAARKEASITEDDSLWSQLTGRRTH